LNKHTLYITFDGLSDPLGQSQILPYLRGIAARGFDITVLSCEKKDKLEKEKENIAQLIGKLPISWKYIIYNEEGGFLSRLHYIRKIFSLAKKACREKKIELIHCRSYLASLIGLSFKLKYRVPFIFDMRGFWADERLDGGIWNTRHLLQKFFYNYFKSKENQFIRKSDAIISLTNAAVSELGKRYTPGFINGKTIVIPCCTNTDLFNRHFLKSSATLPGISAEDHVIIYTGSIGTWYYTREMIDCIFAWKNFIPGIKLLILTKDTEELQKILDSYPAEQKKFIVSASVTYKEVPAYLAMAKAAIFFIKPAYSKIASSPTKMAECWAMDLPIITNSGIGDNDLYFNTHKGGILINNFTSAEYVAACHNYLELSNKANAYREIALNYFDTRMAIEKYTSVYKSLVRGL
jgi:glycosyltransferase involved in cell wall biosynthesis